MEWISVKDRLPKSGKTVLVYGGIARYDEDCHYWYSLTGFDWPGRRIAWDVTYWMDLPQPPETE